MIYKIILGALITGILTTSMAMAQTPGKCITPADVSKSEQQNKTFLTKNMNNLSQKDQTAISAMLDKVLEPMRKNAISCNPNKAAAVKEEIKEEFTKFYSQIGVGGRMLFDNYQVPLTNGPWMGGTVDK